MSSGVSIYELAFVLEQWRFYVGARPPNLAQAPKFLFGSIVISLNIVASQMMRGHADDAGPPNIFS